MAFIHGSLLWIWLESRTKHCATCKLKITPSAKVAATPKVESAGNTLQFSGWYSAEVMPPAQRGCERWTEAEKQKHWWFFSYFSRFQFHFLACCLTALRLERTWGETWTPTTKTSCCSFLVVLGLFPFSKGSKRLNTTTTPWGTFEFLFGESTWWMCLTHRACRQKRLKSDYFAFCCTKITVIQFWVLAAAKSVLLDPEISEKIFFFPSEAIHIQSRHFWLKPSIHIHLSSVASTVPQKATIKKLFKLVLCHPVSAPHMEGGDSEPRIHQLVIYEQSHVKTIRHHTD